MNTQVQIRSKRCAFTLVEILLAMGIFSMVIIAIYSSWSAIMRGTRVGLTAAAEVQRTRVAIRSMEEALGAAVMYADNPLYYGFYADTSQNFGYLSFVARLPESFPGSGLFPGQPLRRVTFSVDDDRNLLLIQSTLLDVSPQPYSIKLSPKTAVFAMEFFDARLNEWVPEWMATNALPNLVRVALDFGDKTSPETVTIRSVPLSAFAITRVGGAQAQMPGGQLGQPGGGQDNIQRGNSGREGGGRRGGNMGGGNPGGFSQGGTFGGANEPRWSGPPGGRTWPPSSSAGPNPVFNRQ